METTAGQALLLAYSAAWHAIGAVSDQEDIPGHNRPPRGWTRVTPGSQSRQCLRAPTSVSQWLQQAATAAAGPRVRWKCLRLPVRSYPGAAKRIVAKHYQSIQAASGGGGAGLEAGLGSCLGRPGNRAHQPHGGERTTCTQLLSAAETAAWRDRAAGLPVEGLHAADAVCERSTPPAPCHAPARLAAACGWLPGPPP